MKTGMRSSFKQIVYFITFTAITECAPSEGEVDTYQSVNEVMKSSRDVLTALQQYKTAAHEIREVGYCFYVR